MPSKQITPEEGRIRQLMQPKNESEYIIKVFRIGFLVAKDGSIDIKGDEISEIMKLLDDNGYHTAYMLNYPEDSST